MSRLTRGGFALVLMLATLPLNGTVCAALCATPAATAPASGAHDSSHHHGSSSHHQGNGTRIHHAPSSPAQPRLESLAGHNCGDHGAIDETTPALTAGRADMVGPVPQSLVPFTAVGLDRASTEARPFDDPTLGIKSPTRAPLVLRI